MMMMMMMMALALKVTSWQLHATLRYTGMQHARRGKASELLKLMQFMQLICAFCFSRFLGCLLHIFFSIFWVRVGEGWVLSVACWAAKCFELTKIVNCINRCMRWQRAEANCRNEWLNANSAADGRCWRQGCGGHKCLNNYSLCSIYSFMLPLREPTSCQPNISQPYERTNTHTHTLIWSGM